MRGALALALALLPAPALAQAVQCALPQRLAPLPAPRPDGPVRKLPVASYVLAVSWSPHYCQRDRDPDSLQCSGKHGRFGFVLHGLWPQSASGPSPQWCSLTPRPTPAQVRAQMCMTPVPWMPEHEWAKHGSCMARTPAAYFARSASLWRSLKWPDMAPLARQRGLTAGDLRRALARTNPRFKPGQIGLLVGRDGALQELRFCYSRRFQPIACQRSTMGPPDSARLTIRL